MPGAWSRLEVEATVADYFAMFQQELTGTPFNKAEHNRQLTKVLNGRTEGSVEFKHCNITAVLNDKGIPGIIGYKPRSNYQSLLAKVVSDWLSAHPQLLQKVEADVDGPALVPTIDDILSTLVDPPVRGRSRRVANRRVAERVLIPYAPPPASGQVNYLEREGRNRDLGRAGEEYVVRFEQARLVTAGCEKLASQIQHVSRSGDDSAGFDVLSYEVTGQERLIEVKTTKYGKETPFFVSRNELDVSKRHADAYYLYRAFSFRQQPHLFTLPGALSHSCTLDPSTYRASVA